MDLSTSSLRPGDRPLAGDAGDPPAHGAVKDQGEALLLEERPREGPEIPQAEHPGGLQAGDLVQHVRAHRHPRNTDEGKHVAPWVQPVGGLEGAGRGGVEIGKRLGGIDVVAFVEQHRIGVEERALGRLWDGALDPG